MTRIPCKQRFRFLALEPRPGQSHGGPHGSRCEPHQCQRVPGQAQGLEQVVNELFPFPDRRADESPVSNAILAKSFCCCVYGALQ